LFLFSRKKAFLLLAGGGWILGVMPKSVHIFSLTRLAKNCLLAAATETGEEKEE